MDVRALHERLRRRGRTALARRVGIDVRALAALRLSLGALLLVDLFVRSRDLVTFYSDAGVLPRAVLSEQFPALARLSLHAVSGSAWVQGLLFIVAGAAAVALLVGYRTTLASVVSFALLASLHARNPVVLNAGDSLLRRLLFWGAFLPLGERWSLDALRAARERTADGTPSLREAFERGGSRDGRKTDRKRVLSVASAALLIQVVVVYVANAAFKLRGNRWLRGEGTRYAFSLEQLTADLGATLAEYPLALAAVDRVWLGLLVAAALLVAFTGTRRAVFAGAFVVAHLGMALTMRLGVFPFVSIAGLLAFLPPRVWDGLGKLRATQLGAALDVGKRLLARGERALHRGELSARRAGRQSLARLLGRERPQRRRGRSHPVGLADCLRSLAGAARRSRPAVVAVLLGVVLVWNGATLGALALPDEAASVADPEEHRWDMFAPEPRETDGWYVVPAELSSGERRDALRGTAVDWDAPPEDSPATANVRWYKYLVDLQRSDNAALRPHFADYLCRDWSATHETEIKRLAVYRVEQPTRLDGPEPTRRVEQLDYSCPTNGAES